MQLVAEVAEQPSNASRSVVLVLGQSSMELEQEIVRAYELLRLPLYQYLAAVLGNASEAEDIVQEVFLRLFVHCSGRGMIAPERQRSWIFRVAHNLAIDRLRSARFVRELDSETHRATLLELPDAGSTPEESALDGERLQAIRKGLSQLSSQERHCLYLRAEGFRYREVAEILGISSSSVAEFLRRAIRKLMRDSHAQTIETR